ncbi:hypothetical protein DFR58_14121 [Anaerobacterium chartisolvens]|uniref:Uncharacterized protein n=1 Tax=Anaerobacterium chartisolvens TaxID=1297424 RepID=A0A369AK07_9FIRM|nr:hypothetical protein [Anaerobacterium chartisolvens]RCX08678.1 hypothetical protein DFR58_14121 [Anaerobacterium chartisolvens]
MDTMNIIVLLLVSIPESIFNLFLGFLITGQKEYIFINSLRKLLKLITTAAIMSISSYVIRTFVPIGIMTIGLHFIAYTIIIKFCYRIKITKSLASVTFFTGFLMTVEILYIPPLAIFIQKNILKIYDDNILRIVCTIPERIIQFIAVIWLWNCGVVLVDLKKYKDIRKMATIILLILYAIEMFSLFTFIKQIDIMDLTTKVTYMLICIGFVALNILMFKFISKFTATVIEEETRDFKKHKEAVDLAINKINVLIGNKNNI